MFIANGNRTGKMGHDRARREKAAPKPKYTGPRASDLQTGQIFYVLDEGHQKVMKGKTEVVTQGPWQVLGVTPNSVMATHMHLKVANQFPRTVRVSLTQPQD